MVSLWYSFDVIDLLRTQLKPDPGLQFEHEFQHFPTAVPVGHVFEHDGREWEVTWAAPEEIGWLLMLVPITPQSCKNPSG